MDRGLLAQCVAVVLVGLLIVALALSSAGLIPGLAQIVGGALAVVVVVLLLAASGSGGFGE